MRIVPPVNNMSRSASEGVSALNAEMFVLFTLDEQVYAVRLEVVERVSLAVAITYLKKAPEIVLGVVNLEGQIVAVVNVRKRLGLEERKISIDDQFLFVRTTRRMFALVVDSVGEVAKLSQDQTATADQIVPGLEHVAGIVKLADGLILVHDLEQFLSLEEERVLSEAMVTEQVKQ